MMHLITGGSGSGKSAYAEEWLRKERKEEEKPLLYVATMRPYGAEGREKIQRHQRMRAGKGFQTLECPVSLKTLELPENGGVLLECVSNLAANELFGEDGKMRKGRKAEDEILEGIRRLREQTACLVVVTNEVTADLEAYGETTKEYQRLMGRINVALGSMAERVTEVVYGIPVWIRAQKEKGE